MQALPPALVWVRVCLRVLLVWVFVYAGERVSVCTASVGVCVCG